MVSIVWVGSRHVGKSRVSQVKKGLSLDKNDTLGKGETGGGGSFPRREFLRSAALGIASVCSADSVRISAESPPAARNVEYQKKLSKRWIASLFERGQPTVYKGSDLGYIGMPIGGITAGQLYLGGDGRLWLWDIFNQTPPVQQPGAAHYSNPLVASWFRSVDQGFTLRILEGAASQRRPLERGGFSDISFRGEYPIGYVQYREPACPVSVVLEAFSPFIPLNVNDSSIPATILRFALTNTSNTTVSGDLTGLLENAVARSANQDFYVRRTNTIEREADFLLLNCSATASTPTPHPDDGTMGLVLLSARPSDSGSEFIVDRPTEAPAGVLTRKFSLAPGASEVATFAIVWHFPNLSIKWSFGGPPFERIALKGNTRRHYALRFDSAAAVARYVARNFDRLYAETKLWHDTWYDFSTLPHWLLERTLLNVSTLATSTAFRFADGRFYGSEGVGSGPGTPTHVWQAEQAMGRLFPELDVALRESTDFNPAISFNPDGRINVRGELSGWEYSSIDGQASIVLRSLRDHQTSADQTFLQRNWPRIREATQWLIAQDGNGDGILEGPQANTLDATWYGPVAWLSGLYLAAVRAAEEMALDMDDREFALQCRDIVEKGYRNMVERLFSEDYFINQPDPRRPDALNSGTGCGIGQVLGQGWAFQLGLGRVLPEKETRSALAALWRHNFLTDIGSYRAVNLPGRWYAMPGEAGLLMCTFPRKDWDFSKATGTVQEADVPGFFNECMTGFEHSVAAHLIWEGMVTEGLAVERAVHDRYHASRRNPWNEVEDGDHYARAMASYGVYIGVCGFEYHGPKGYIAFAPRLCPEDFKGAFTAAQGWGTFTQSIQARVLTAVIDVKYGSLRLQTISLGISSSCVPAKIGVTVNGAEVHVTSVISSGRVRIKLPHATNIEVGGQIAITVSGHANSESSRQD